ncbi:MAG: PBSX family phage terminase large subunit [Elusimicrobiota bacterium]|jgi:PBSX family phage terminase large subunit|nr:PBSX family phage terminase large subunit [Elusimicrobiota bacterium]
MFQDQTNKIELSISEMISPDFYDVFYSILEKKYTHYWLKGGRGSGKSSFISIEIILNIIQHKSMNCICFRKYGNNLRESVYNQLIWAIDILGVREYFSYIKNPLEITYLPTGQKILFRGLDDPVKQKSIKMPYGYFGLAWFEELEEYDGMEEIRKVTQSLMRGGSFFIYFYSYNPPQTVSNWVNFESVKDIENRLVHTSNYKSMPVDWLGKEFLIEAALLQKSNELAYRHEYLGEVTGTGGRIFNNIVSRPISDEEIKRFERFSYGIDWGFAVDPFSFGKFYYDRTRRILWVIDEVYGIGILNDEVKRLIEPKITTRDEIIADSEEPKSIEEFSRDGFKIVGSQKGKDSVRFGIKWLQRLQAIVIDQKRTPNAFKEFNLYEFEKNKLGEFRSDYPDKDNHFLDCARYAMEPYIRKRGIL